MLIILHIYQYAIMEISCNSPMICRLDHSIQCIFYLKCCTSYQLRQKLFLAYSKYNDHKVIFIAPNGVFMFKVITYSTLVSLICVTSLYTMDEPFMCKVPREDSEMVEPEELTKIVSLCSQEQALKQLADRWGWNVSIEEAGRLDRLMGKFSEEYGLSELHPTIEAEVHKVFKACNITEPVLVLQNHNSTNSACHPLVDEEWYPVKAMAIGVGDKRGSGPLSLIRFAIFHECGHIVAGDVEQNSKNNLLKNLSLVTTLFGAGTYTGMRAAKALHAYPKSVCLSGRSWIRWFICIRTVISQND